MKRRFTDEQIIQIIKEQKAGKHTADVYRQHGISEGIFCKCKSQCGGVDPSDARRLKALEDENARLKKLLAGARSALEEWRLNHNQHKPHSALGNLTPKAIKSNSAPLLPVEDPWGAGHTISRRTSEA